MNYLFLNVFSISLTVFLIFELYRAVKVFKDCIKRQNLLEKAHSDNSYQIKDYLQLLKNKNEDCQNQIYEFSQKLDLSKKDLEYSNKSITELKEKIENHNKAINDIIKAINALNA